MAQCITCGSELDPERAEKYNYCMKPECQEKNLKGVTMVAVGVNKSAEQYLILDEQIRDDLASGKFADQRRGLVGTSVASSGSTAPAGAAQPGAAATACAAVGVTVKAPRTDRQPQHRPAPRRPWSRSQERLTLLYNEQGKRPDEIAEKLGLSTYMVTQIILSSRNRGKL
jgi:hypothetical protein